MTQNRAKYKGKAASKWGYSLPRFYHAEPGVPGAGERCRKARSQPSHCLCDPLYRGPGACPSGACEAMAYMACGDSRDATRQLA